MGKKKVLRITNGVFLLRLYSDHIETCEHVKYAMDLSDLPWETVSSVMYNLHRQGYKQAKIVEVKK